MFGRAAKKAIDHAIEKLKGEVQTGAVNAAAVSLLSEVLSSIDEDDVLTDLGRDLGRGLLDRRQFKTHPFTVEIRIWRIPISIRFPAITIYSRLKSGTDTAN